VVGEVAEVIVPVAGPLTWVQVPVPTLGVFPAMVTLPTLEQIDWAGPATDVVGTSLTVMVTLEVEGVQGLLVMAHWKTYAPGVVKPVIVVVGEPGVVIVAVTGPLICDQEPVPVVAGLPAMVTLPAVTQIVCGEPEFAMVGGAFTMILT
jgi:hypothetical protein